MNSTRTVFLHFYKDEFLALILADCHSLNAMADLRFLTNKNNLCMVLKL